MKKNIHARNNFNHCKLCCFRTIHIYLYIGRYIKTINIRLAWVIVGVLACNFVSCITKETPDFLAFLIALSGL